MIDFESRSMIESLALIGAEIPECFSEDVLILIEENQLMRKSLNDVCESLEREYWSEYAGLDETRAILDAALDNSSPENS